VKKNFDFHEDGGWSMIRWDFFKGFNDIFYFFVVEKMSFFMRERNYFWFWVNDFDVTLNCNQLG
jgi:hypothetical protein